MQTGERKWFTKKQFHIGVGIFALVTICLLICIKFQKATHLEIKELYVNNMGNFSAEEGFYYNKEGFLEFYDYSSGQNAVVCNKLNCEHKPWGEDTPEEQRCDAYIINCQSIFVYGEQLYIVEGDPEKGVLLVVESELDRSRKKIIATLNSEYIGSYVIKDAKLYFATLVQEMEKDESGMPIPTGVSEVSFCSLDLRNGKIEKYIVMDSHYNAQLSILGIYQDRIYCFYGYFMDKFTGFNYEEAKNKLEWYTFDIKTGKMNAALKELSDIDMNLCLMEEGKIFYGKWEDRESEESDVYYYDMDTEVNKKIISDSFGIQIVDSKLIAEDQDENLYTIYDIESGETSHLTYQWSQISVQAEYEDNFIVGVYEQGKVEYAIMKKKDYYKGSADFEVLDKDHISK